MLLESEVKNETEKHTSRRVTLLGFGRNLCAMERNRFKGRQLCKSICYCCLALGLTIPNITQKIELILGDINHCL